MRWRGYRQSGNLTSRGGMIAGGGVGALVLAVVAMLLGVDPGAILQQAPEQGAQAPAANDTMVQFTGAVLASTEDAWSEVFQQANQDYPEPQLATFSGAVQSACGMGQSAMGPFYCPRDQTIYIDLSFFTDLRDRFGAAGDFAQAYVIAHEVGHHVQNVTGLLQSGGGNEQSVRQELQADCFAGIWGYIANNRQRTQGGEPLIEPGDVEEALDAAAAIGDDRLQKQTQGQVVPESFTHGSSAQRVAAFRRGFESGNLQACSF
jgi:predicted metalloprotease